MSLHMINLIRFYNRALRIRTRKWFSPKVISTPCAKKKEIRQRPKKRINTSNPLITTKRFISSNLNSCRPKRSRSIDFIDEWIIWNVHMMATLLKLIDMRWQRELQTYSSHVQLRKTTEHWLHRWVNYMKLQPTGQNMFRQLLWCAQFMQARMMQN